MKNSMMAGAAVFLSLFIHASVYLLSDLIIKSKPTKKSIIITLGYTSSESRPVVKDTSTDFFISPSIGGTVPATETSDIRSAILDSILEYADKKHIYGEPTLDSSLDEYTTVLDEIQSQAATGDAEEIVDVRSDKIEPVATVSTSTNDVKSKSVNDDVINAGQTPVSVQKNIPSEPKAVKKPAVYTSSFVSDRVKGQINFKGQRRDITFLPSAPDFKLSNNACVNVFFKIDKYGKTFDIKVEPVSADVEIAVADFVGKLRFTAVIYDIPDEANISINIRVK